MYNAVKTAIIYAENFDPQREAYIAPLNELRSALDHIFRASTSEDNMEYEIKEVKEHMNRAGYDALEILAGNVGYNILDKMTPYSVQCITNIFPKFYTEITPKITSIKMNLAEIRSKPKGSIDKSFLLYLNDIDALLDINKQVESMIPSLEIYCTGIEKDKTKNTVLMIIIPLIAAALASVLTWILK